MRNRTERKRGFFQCGTLCSFLVTHPGQKLQWEGKAKSSVFCFVLTNTPSSPVIHFAPPCHFQFSARTFFTRKVFSWRVLPISWNPLLKTQCQLTNYWYPYGHWTPSYRGIFTQWLTCSYWNKLSLEVFHTGQESPLLSVELAGATASCPGKLLF